MHEDVNVQRQLTTEVSKPLSTDGPMSKDQPGKSLAMAPPRSGQNTLTLKLPKSPSILISEVISRDILPLNTSDCGQVHLKLRFFQTCRHHQTVSHTVSRCPTWLEKAQRAPHPPEVTVEGVPWWPGHGCKGLLCHLLLPKVQLKINSKY